MWSPYERCKELVKNEWMDGCRWNCGNPVMLFKKKAKSSMVELQIWSRTEFEGRKKKLNQLLQQLQSKRENHEQYVSGEEIKNIEKQIDEILLEEEIYWRQRFRAVWLQEGDKNTKFFHYKDSPRKRKNTIERILDENRKWTEETDQIERMFYEHFANLFTSTHPSDSQLEKALNHMPQQMTDEMNEQLNQMFTEEEIVVALKQMHPTTAPGPDGLPAVFFQKHWKSVSEGVISTCLHILNEGGNVAPLNHTYIALMPKSDIA